MPVLAEIYSRSDAFKRKLVDALRNPMGTLENMAGNAYDGVIRLGRMTKDAAAEGMEYGPASQRLAMTIADAYNPAGVTVYHGGASRVTKPDLAKAGSVSGIPEESGVFWVTPSKESAKRFGEAASKNPVVSEFDLASKNQGTLEYPTRAVIDGTLTKLKIEALRQARKEGRDSLLLRQAGQNRFLDDEIAVFDPAILRALGQ